MNTRDIKTISHKLLGIYNTHGKVALALGLSNRSWAGMRSGERKIPKPVELLIPYILQEHALTSERSDE